MIQQEKNSFRKTAKSTAVYGSAQLIQMLITLVRAKFVAVILGSSGMGMNALFQSALSTIQQFSSLGIFQSSVRELSQARQSGDKMRFSRLKKVFESIVWITGSMGVVVCLLCSKWLSIFTFKTEAYTISFIFIAVALLFMALSNSRIVIMQVTQSLNYLAKASVLGALLSLLIGVPLYYLLGLKGIVPAIVAGYLVFFLVNNYFARKIKFEKVSVSSKDIFNEGRPIIRLGVLLMVSQLIMTALNFSLNSFISWHGGVNDVGYFQAAVSICLQSMVVINSTLASDYFPRLSAICRDQNQLGGCVNEQAELVVLLTAPISIFLLVLAPWVVRLLFAPEFVIIVPVLRWMMLSLIFRGLWMVLGYIALAKGDKKTFFIYDAIIGHGMNFVINLVAYYWKGLYGLGVSYVVGAVMMCFILWGVAYKIYRFNFTPAFFKLLGIFVVISLLAVLVLHFLQGLSYYMAALLLLTGVTVFSYYQLDRRIQLTKLIKEKIKKAT